MTRSEELFERAKAVIPGGVSSPVRAFKAVGGTPLFVARAEGARFWDEDGRAFVDYVGSWGPMILGHAHPAVLEAVRERPRRGTSFGAPCAARGGAGRAGRAPRAVGREGALRLLRHRGHDERAARRARLHRPRARSSSSTAATTATPTRCSSPAGSGVATLGIPGSPGVPEGTVADTLVAPFNDVGGGRSGRSPRTATDLAAVIVEPVVREHGRCAPEPGYLEALREITRRNGHAADLRRGHDRLPPRPRRRAAALRHHARPDLPRQDRRRRAARPRPTAAAPTSWRTVAPDGPGLPGGHALRKPAGDGRGRDASLDLLARPGTYEALEALQRAASRTGLRRAAARRRSRR